MRFELRVIESTAHGDCDKDYDCHYENARAKKRECAPQNAIRMQIGVGIFSGSL